VAITDEIIGFSQLFGAHAQADPPKSTPISTCVHYQTTLVTLPVVCVLPRTLSQASLSHNKMVLFHTAEAGSTSE